LLNALMGVLPSRGKIDYTAAGRPAVARGARDAGHGVVPETRALFGTMPVEDNLLLGGYRQVRLAARTAARRRKRSRAVPA
jgi:branched-chain amino acid transport system ATP-binding protein